MTIALGKSSKEEKTLFDTVDDWLRRDRFVFVGLTYDFTVMGQPFGAVW